MKILQSQPNLNCYTSCNILASNTNSLLDYIYLSLWWLKELLMWLTGFLDDGFKKKKGFLLKKNNVFFFALRHYIYD